jgi:copper oxidase (laccase) domain-containing protein
LDSIVINAVKQMQKNYILNPKDIICCICPSIRKCHFEVDEDVKDLFYNKYKFLPNINDIIEIRDNKYHIKTVLLNKTLLLNIGLREENIIDSNIYSVCNQT